MGSKRAASTHVEAMDAWPSLPYERGRTPTPTLHMWTQIIGKIALAHVDAGRNSSSDQI